MHTIAIVLPLMLAACAGQPQQASGSSGAAKVTPERRAQITDAAASPLKDFNIARDDIPAVLRAAQKQPYAAPASRRCASLATDIKALDEVLGADLDVPIVNAQRDLSEKGATLAGDAAVGAFRSSVENLVPFRGWVRKLSGAEQFEREVAAAVAAGVTRRAFLKGIGEASGCRHPAAPQR